MAGITGQSVVPLLEANNFNNWHFRIMTVLRKEQCHEVINMDQPAAAASTEEINKFNKADGKAQAIIVQGISDKHLDIIKDCKTAREQLAALKDVFVRTSAFTKLSLWRKLFNLQSGENEKLKDHFLKFDTIIRDLKDLGSTMDESDRVCLLLLSLPSKFDTVITALETLPNVKMDFVKARLLDEEIKFHSKEETRNEEVSFKVTTYKRSCYSCGSYSHFQAQCPKRNQTNGRFRGNWRGRGRGRNNGQVSGNSVEQNKKNKENKNVAIFAANVCTNIESSTGKISFILDSGATNHFVQEKLEQFMDNIKILPKPVSICIANGEVLQATKIGIIKATCQGYTVTIEALIVPKMKHNLISASKMTSKGHKIIVKKDITIIKGQNFNLKCENKRGLYVLTLDDIIKDTSEFGLAVDILDNYLWHRRLGHVGNDALKQLGLKQPDKICETCVEGKLTRVPFHQHERTSNKIGDLVHSDVCGPITPDTFDGGKYFQVIMDDYSHFVIVKILQHKNEAEQNLIDYVNQVKTQHNIKVKRFRLDNGGEFSSRSFRDFCKKKGIFLEYTMPYSPQMNGKAERMNRTLLNMIRTKILDSGIPKYLWGEALKCSVYELNRTPTTALKIGKTPSYLWHGRNDLSKLKIFGCRAWFVSLPRGNKIQARAKKTVFMGYCGGGYRLWKQDDKKIVRSRDVKFDESVMGFKDCGGPEVNAKDPNVINHMDEEPQEDDIQGQAGDQPDNAVEQFYDAEDEHYNHEDSENNSSGEDDSELSYNQDITTRSGRNVKMPNNLKDYEVYEAYCFLSTSSQEPQSFTDAEKSPEWKQAIEAELKSHEVLNTWTPVTLPEGEIAIDTKWIFKIKDDGTRKARLVAKGFQEPFEPGGEFSYAPVCRLPTIRILMSISIQKEWNLRQIDVPTAFLNGTLDKNVYIKVPQGLNTTHKHFVLNRALYGLRSSPKCWNLKFNDIMTKLGFKRSSYDFCLYVKEDVYLVFFVDDAIITGPDINVNKLLQDLKNEFNIKIMNKITSFLGMEMVKTESGLKIHQSKIIGRLCKEFGMEDCRSVATPMETNFHLTEDEVIENIPFRRLVCSLMYISVVTRPDISYSVAYLSRYLDRPTEKAWKAAKRILRYLKSTQNLGLFYSKAKEEMYNLEAMCDADWGADRSTRRSVSGFVCFHAGNPIAWHSRKQNCVALSSMEAEYVSACTAAQELINAKGVLTELIGCDIVLLKVDNLSAISMMHSFENSKRGKHIEICFHFIEDLCLRKEINIKYISSNENVADLFTKSLGKEKFLKFRNYLVV